jgi:hypothetical protein
VGDVNDHNPVWDQSQYNVNVSEVTPPGNVIMTLQAYDADIGLNGKLTYLFTPLQADTSLGLFALNASTGEVSSC